MRTRSLGRLHARRHLLDGSDGFPDVILAVLLGRLFQRSRRRREGVESGHRRCPLERVGRPRDGLKIVRFHRLAQDLQLLAKEVAELRDDLLELGIVGWER